MNMYIPLSEVRKVYPKSLRQFRREKQNWHITNNKVLIYSLPEELQRYFYTKLSNKNNKSNTKNEARIKIIGEYKQSGLAVVDFCKIYNKGLSKRIGTDDVYPSISHMTLYRWLDKLASNNLIKLNKGYGKALDEEDKRIIKSLYFTTAKWSVAKVYRKWASMKEEAPVSYRTVKRYIGSLPPILHALREGGKYLNDKFMPYVVRDYTKYEVMQLWVSDHHQFDFYVRDGKSVYRPYLTAFVDMRSRKPMGWVISRYPSSYTILNALYNGIQSYGLPSEMLFDNGKDYRSKRLQGTSIFLDEEKIRIQGVFERYKIQVHFCEPYHGQSKPIERWFRTISDDFSKELPSYVGSNTKTTLEERNRNWKMIKDSVSITLDDVRVAFDEWVERFNNRIHTGEGMNATPNEVFNAYYKNVIRIDLDRNYRQELFAKEEWHKVGRNGIKFEGINYWSVELIRLQGNKKKYRVVRDIDDIGQVCVYDKEGNFICEAYNKHIGENKTEEDIKEVKKKRKIIKQSVKTYLSVDLQGSTLEEQLHNLKKEKEVVNILQKKASGFSYWQ